MACADHDRLSTLRLELKQWEKRFATAHNGRKASRDEIKADAEIAAKYKEYNRLREAPNASHPAPRQNGDEMKDPISPSASRKRKRSKDVERSPSKHVRGSAMETPRKSRFVEQFTPSSGNKHEEDAANTTPAITRTFVGPTPQKDGLVLGLFDMLDPVDNPGTPSKTGTERPLQETAHNVVASTPRKSNIEAQAKLLETPQTGARQRFVRTPQSLGQRFLLDQFITPSKRKRDDDNDGSAQYPGDNNGKENDESTTPAFLKRDSRSIFNHGLSRITEDAETGTFSPSKAPSRPISAFGFNFGFGKGPKRRNLGRSLSDMIADMRKAEDDMLDEEAEIMREMESGGAAPIPAPRLTTAQKAVPAVIVEDSQAPLPHSADRPVPGKEIERALGPDGTGDLSADSDEAKELEQNAGRKVWKKKGQKRTTRRVHMKPRAKVSRLTDDDGHSDSSGTERNNEEPVQERHDGDFTPGDDSSQHKNASNEKNPSKAKEKSESGVKATVRKVSNAAHANFRKLKIKSKNGSGKSNGRRFGRR